MNPYLDDDLVTLGEHAQRFAQGRVAPGFQERDRTRVLDRELMREMGQMGFIAPELPEAFGGQGMGCLAAGVIHEAIAAADLSISLHQPAGVAQRPDSCRAWRSAGGRTVAAKPRKARPCSRLR